MTFELLKEANGKAVRVTGNYFQLWNGALEKSDFFDDDWKEVTRALEELKFDTDIADFLHRHFPGMKHEELRKKVRGFVEGYDAADMDRVSAFALREEWAKSDDEHQYRIEGGYATLIEFLADKVREHRGSILLSSPVREIQWTHGAVKVITTDGRLLEAQKAIITLPLGVLQRGSVRFSPVLSEVALANQKMGFGGVIKFFFEFKHALWEDTCARRFKRLAFAFSDAPVPTWWTQRPDETALLTGWLGGPATVTTEHEPDALFRKAIASLEYIFKCSAGDFENSLVARHVADWTQDPFAFGAYSYPTVQTGSALEILSKPVKDTLYFAGEHMYNGSAMGTVEAALVSGKKAAETIAGRR